MNKIGIFGIILLSLVFHTTNAQTYIKGILLSSDESPIQGASIQIERSKSLTFSDHEGRFEIRTGNLKDSLYIRHLNYHPIKVAISAFKDTVLKIYLSPLDQNLDEVVISSGYMSIPKERITGSFEKVDQKLASRSTSGNILRRLEGVSSLYFDSRSGTSGISLRGRSTIMGDANPLIIVDGFIFDGDPNSVNPNDVKSITLLKDAAAASIWGARASNGVIVIETNKGRLNQEPQIDFTSTFTAGQRPDLYYDPILESPEFIEVERFLFGKGFYNSSLNNQRFPVVSPVVELLNAQRLGMLSNQEVEKRLTVLSNQDVRKDIDRYFYRNRIIQQYALSYRGGSSMYTYNISAGWDGNQEELKANSNSRLTLMIATTFKLIKNLTIETQVAYSSSKKNRNNSVSEISPTGKSLYPYATLADETGNPLPLEKDYRMAFLDTVGKGRLLDWSYRPIEEMNLADNTSELQNLRMNVSARYTFLKNFNIEIRYQNESQHDGKRQHYSEATYTARNLINRYTSYSSNGLTYAVPRGGILDLSNERSISHNGRGQLNYNINWRKIHNLTAIAGSEIRQVHRGGNITRTYGYNDKTLVFGNVNYTDLFPIYHNLSASQRIPNPNDFTDQMYRFVSFYANTAYTLYNRYSFSFSSRKDASNLFGVNHNQKGTPLWSSGLGWDISKEAFYKVKRIEYLKARISYGFSGNVDNTMSALTTVAYYSNAPLSGYDYAMVRNPGNPDLRWERSGMLNAGVDFSLVRNLLSGTLEFYQRNGTDLIGQAPIDPTTGVNANASFLYKGNVAHMKGYGIDADLHLKLVLGKVYWESDLIFGYAKSKITRYLASSTVASAYVNLGMTVSPVIDKPVYSIFSYKWAGLDPATGDPRGYVEGKPSTNYTAILSGDPATLKYHGSALPTIFGAYRNTFTIKRLSVSANLLYKLNYYFRKSSINYSSLMSNWKGHKDYTKRWQQPGDETFTNVPSLIYPNNGNRDVFYSGSEVLVERGDHVRLKDINISYQLSKFRIYGMIDNLGIIWRANHSGLDPDFFNGGIPTATSFSIGFKTTF
ncbi:SusC/RagA family TonB-linked outer membrane protein [Leadbetterella byssophila]|uniref:SusC/RagA family TonB-linked outer membrane protein n=1 Tax=Leadbetterella byssophila TaxID=316068 RepID=UPI00399F89B2